VTATNKELAKRASEIAKGSDGLARKAANVAAVALGTTGTVPVRGTHWPICGRRI
jgi:hypothetical protein